MKMLLISTAQLLFVFASNAVNAANGSATVKDTVQAVVTYGDSYLLEELGNPDPEVIYPIIDSLLCLDKVPQELLNQLKLYVRIKNMSRTEIIHLTDSLFETDHIPYALINQINLYVSTHADKAEEDIIPWFDEEGAAHPAEALYGEWNTNLPNPYSLELSEGDSVLSLVIASEGKIGHYTPAVIGPITSPYGWRDGSNHSGIDIDLQVWDSVHAAFSGMVRVARWYKGYGRVVVIRHWNGLETLYGHLHRIKVHSGDLVQSGDFIGYGGSSGHSTGSHLHFECRFKGIALNPSSFISFKENKLLNDTIVLKRLRWAYASYPKGARFYTVKRGDFLYKIAEQYGISVRKIRELNGLNQRSVIRVGQKLRVI